MGLDQEKLEFVKREEFKVIARCPACAEAGNDGKGEHLFIGPDGQFGCVIYPGPDGRKHRQRIYELAGAKTYVTDSFSVKKPTLSLTSTAKIIERDILGRLGRLKITPLKKEQHLQSSPKKYIESKTPVPSVPKVYERALARINKNYTDVGIGKFIEEHYPDLHRATRTVGEKVTKLLEQKDVDLAHFEAALNEWENLHKKAAEIYQRESKKGTGNEQISN